MERKPGSSANAGKNEGKTKDDEAEDEDKNWSKEEKQVFDAKFKELQVYIPALKKMITSYEQKQDTKDVGLQKHINRFRSLYALFNSKRRCKLETLLKCEEFFKKRFNKAKLAEAEALENPPPLPPPAPPAPKFKHEKCQKCASTDNFGPHDEDCSCCSCVPAMNHSGNNCCSGVKRTKKPEPTVAKTSVSEVEKVNKLQQSSKKAETSSSTVERKISEVPKGDNKTSASVSSKVSDQKKSIASDLSSVLLSKDFRKTSNHSKNSDELSGLKNKLIDGLISSVNSNNSNLNVINSQNEPSIKVTSDKLEPEKGSETPINLNFPLNSTFLSLPDM